jgi:co-chaperonin GroES (HSP10)
MQAVNYYVVVNDIKDTNVKVAGLELTEKLNEDNRYNKAKIISTGNLVEGVKQGDIIYYDKIAGHAIQGDNKRYTVIRIQDIVLIE